MPNIKLTDLAKAYGYVKENSSTFCRLATTAYHKVKTLSSFPYNELSSCEKNECPKGEFKCRERNYCVPLKYICDGREHCYFGDDELYCGIFHYF